MLWVCHVYLSNVCVCCIQRFFDNVPLKEYLGSGGSPIDAKYIRKIFAKEISPGVPAVTPELFGFADYLVWATTSAERMSHVDLEV